jgi:hypothetical protein|tara:strand:+ start:326 stop:1063 length:738 start_codon:yes stop_codon:yes gene_type:complete
VKNYLFQTLFLIGIALNAQQVYGKITLPLGMVEVKSDSEWKRAKPNQKVFQGNTVRTKARSRCEITLTGGGKIRIGEKSELALNEADVKPMAKTFNADLKKGNVWVSAKAAFGEKKNINMRTPTAVAAIRGTKYRAQAGEDESSVLVYQGSVDVNQVKNFIEERREKRKGLAPKNSPFKLGPVKEIKAPTQVTGPYEVTLEEWVTLAEGMQINVRKDGKYSMFNFDQSADALMDFVKWNKEQDAK